MGEALLPKLPSILKLMIEGLRRLHQQGFTQTACQAALIQEVAELGSPVCTFIRGCCELGDDKQFFLVACGRLG